ncbi:peptidase [Massilia sp. WF1]|uniref:rhomboid family intramembrane serine protease n=1 Tax=unclassified Massilia TaxID=2609279 RepID=UPI00064ABBE9|nr:rhomboid family intramembrane serine protease [Massilia sp. WG5]KLU36740.1 peptidase [Massilia sp. WF1]
MSTVTFLILANSAAYLLELGMAPELMASLVLWPLREGFMPWQLVSYAFLHAGPAHLAVNMFGLWMFGRDVEALLGRAAMFRLYFASVLGAALTQLLVAAASDVPSATLGASGGVFGVLLAYAVSFPRRIIVLLFPPIPMPAWLFVSLYAGLELTLGVMGSDAGVAHFAHLGGMAGAFVVLRRQR